VRRLDKHEGAIFHNASERIQIVFIFAKTLSNDIDVFSVYRTTALEHSQSNEHVGVKGLPKQPMRIGNGVTLVARRKFGEGTSA
jgi:hypothetical protein